jgi:hypothetical protein
MADGTTKPIGSVMLGDKVESTDPTTGETVAEPVVVLHDNHDTDLTDVTVQTSDGKTATLHTTWHHPFWNDTDHTWTDAAKLTPGKALHVLTAPGRTFVAKVIAVKTWTGLHRMRDLTVASVHTYYVIVGTTPILVHNNDCGLAEVKYYKGIGGPTGHFSIEVTNGNEVEHMHLMPYDGVSMVSRVTDQLPVPTATHVFELPDADAALSYMRDSLGDQGPYSMRNNSCLTFCTKTLSAGGMTSAPTGGRAIQWIQDQFATGR